MSCATPRYRQLASFQQLTPEFNIARSLVDCDRAANREVPLATVAAARSRSSCAQRMARMSYQTGWMALEGRERHRCPRLKLITCPILENDKAQAQTSVVAKELQVWHGACFKSFAIGRVGALQSGKLGVLKQPPVCTISCFPASIQSSGMRPVCPGLPARLDGIKWPSADFELRQARRP